MRRKKGFLVSALAGLFVAVGAAPALACGGAEGEKEVSSFRLLGVTFCLPEARIGAQCDVVPEGEKQATARSERATEIVDLLGYRICLGDVEANAPCDLRMPAGAPEREAHERHARLQ